MSKLDELENNPKFLFAAFFAGLLTTGLINYYDPSIVSMVALWAGIVFILMAAFIYLILTIGVVLSLFRVSTAILLLVIATLILIVI